MASKRGQPPSSNLHGAHTSHPSDETDPGTHREEGLEDLFLVDDDMLSESIVAAMNKVETAHQDSDDPSHVEEGMILFENEGDDFSIDISFDDDEFESQLPPPYIPPPKPPTPPQDEASFVDRELPPPAPIPEAKRSQSLGRIELKSVQMRAKVTSSSAVKPRVQTGELHKPLQPVSGTLKIPQSPPSSGIATLPPLPTSRAHLTSSAQLKAIPEPPPTRREPPPAPQGPPPAPQEPPQPLEDQSEATRALQSALREAQKDLDTSNQTLHALRVELDALRVEHVLHVETQDNLAFLQNEYEALQDTHTLLQETAQNTQNALTALQSSSLQREEELQTQLNNLRAQHEELQTTLRALQSEHNPEMLQTLHEELRTLRDEYTTLFNDFETLQSEHTSLLKEHQEHQNQSTSHAADLQEQRAQFEVLQQEYQAFQEQTLSAAANTTPPEEYEATIESLEERNTALHAEHEALQNEHTSLQGLHRSLRTEHEELQDTHETFVEEHQALQGLHRSIHTEYQSLEDERDTLRTQLVALREDHTSLQEQAKSDALSLRTELDQKSEENIALTEQATQLEQLVASLREEIAQHQNSSNDTEAFETLQSEHTTLQDEHASLLSLHRSLRDEFNALQDELEDIRDNPEIDELKTQTDAQRKEIQRLTQHVQELENNSAPNEEFTFLQQEHEELGRAYETLQNAHFERGAQLMNTLAEGERIRANLANIAQELQKAKEEANTLRSSINERTPVPTHNHTEEIQELQNALNTRNETIQRLQGEIDELRSSPPSIELDDTRAELDALKALQSAFKDTKKSLQERVSDLNNQLEFTQQRLEKNQTIYQEQNVLLVQTQTELKAAQKRIAERDEHVSELRDQLQTVRERNDRYASKLDNLDNLGEEIQQLRKDMSRQSMVLPSISTDQLGAPPSSPDSTRFGRPPKQSTHDAQSTRFGVPPAETDSEDIIYDPEISSDELSFDFSDDEFIQPDYPEPPPAPPHNPPPPSKPNPRVETFQDSDFSLQGFENENEFDDSFSKDFDLDFDFEEDMDASSGQDAIMLDDSTVPPTISQHVDHVLNQSQHPAFAAQHPPSQAPYEDLGVPRELTFPTHDNNPDLSFDDLDLEFSEDDDSLSLDFGDIEGLDGPGATNSSPTLDFNDIDDDPMSHSSFDFHNVPAQNRPNAASFAAPSPQSTPHIPENDALSALRAQNLLARTAVANYSLAQNINPREGFFLSLVGNGETIQDLIDLSGLSPQEGATIVAGLINRGVLQLQP